MPVQPGSDPSHSRKLMPAGRQWLCQDRAFVGQALALVHAIKGRKRLYSCLGRLCWRTQIAGLLF